MFVVSPVARPSSLEERPGERRQVADARVAARVVDEHRPGTEAAAAAPLGQAVALERAQEPGRGRLRQLRVLHDAVERHGLVALDEASEDPRRAVDRLGASSTSSP